MNIEDHIRRAMEDGKFDNLPGKGKPLQMDENAFEDPEWRLANKVLKDGGFILPWIESRREIEEGLEEARATLKRAWSRHQEGLAQREPDPGMEAVWQRAQDAFRERLAAINKRIFHYNLEVPSPRFQRLSADAQREIEAIQKGEI